VNAHALSVLELPRVLEFVAGHATSALGAARVKALTPSTDIAGLEREQTCVAAVRSIIVGEEPWHPDPIPDLADALSRLRVAGSRWNGQELLNGASCCGRRAALDRASPTSGGPPSLAAYSERSLRR